MQAVIGWHHFAVFPLYHVWPSLGRTRGAGPPKLMTCQRSKGSYTLYQSLGPIGPGIVENESENSYK